MSQVEQTKESNQGTSTRAQRLQ